MEPSDKSSALVDDKVSEVNNLQDKETTDDRLHPGPSTTGSHIAFNLTEDKEGLTDPGIDAAHQKKEEQKTANAGNCKVGEKSRNRNKRRQSGGQKRNKRNNTDTYVEVNTFLNGGNKNDPLNLKEIDHTKNVESPTVSNTNSPSQIQSFKMAPIAILPGNLKDPLRLTTDGPMTLNKKKKKRKNKNKQENADKNTKTNDSDLKSDELNKTTEASNNACFSAAKKDPIVSPAIKQDYSRQQPMNLTKADRKRTLSLRLDNLDPVATKRKKRNSRTTAIQGEHGHDKNMKKENNQKSRVHQAASSVACKSQDEVEKLVKNVKFRAKDAEFQFGNYSRYYGYRCNNKFEDNRMKLFSKDWFKDKDVLDIGCNSGQLTLLIARDFCPRKIVGVDIDKNLISAARANTRHYTSATKRPAHSKVMNYPSSFATEYGSLTGPPLETGDGDSNKFPNNVTFIQGNYVPEKPISIDVQEPEYDVILCLSVTKWLHLNWGDDGLKRTFMRMFKQLRPGGKLILEPQPWKSYAKKKKVSETVFRNFHLVEMRPDHFCKYLTNEVGFVKSETLCQPQKQPGGFERPIYLFSKPE